MHAKKIIFLFLYLLLLCACEKWDIAREDFIQVNIFEPAALSIVSVQLNAEIRDLEIGQISDHGFIWTAEEATPTLFFNQGKNALGIKTKEDDPDFSATLEDLTPKTRYTFVAYAILEEEEHYSDPITYWTGKGGVLTHAPAYEGGTSLDLKGNLEGTETGIVAIKHGFCWAITHTLPTLEDEFVNMGVRRTDSPFTYTLDSLRNNTPVFLRAYAIFQINADLDTAYGNVISFDGDLNYWAQTIDFGSVERANAIGFAIGNKGYVGTGRKSLGKLKDFWEYDAENEIWTQKADFGGFPRDLAVGFAIGNKGYVGTGADEISNETKDFWEYAPQTNTWSRMADFGGGPRSAAAGFAIGDKGYIGTGNIPGARYSLNDFWEYDPPTNTWSRMADFPGAPRVEAVGFAIADKGYIGTGQDTSDQEINDFWEYDPPTNTWSRKVDIGGFPRQGALGFAIGSNGYVGMGFNEEHQYQNDIWEYDPQTNQWTSRILFDGIPRRDAISFVIGDIGYIGTGQGIDLGGRTLNLKDFWKYIP